MSTDKKNDSHALNNFFLLHKDHELIKLKKGTHKEDVIKMFGEPYKITEGNNPRNKKHLFKISNGTSKDNCYEMLFLDDYLEWALKTRK